MAVGTYPGEQPGHAALAAELVRLRKIETELLVVAETARDMMMDILANADVRASRVEALREIARAAIARAEAGK